MVDTLLPAIRALNAHPEDERKAWRAMGAAAESGMTATVALQAKKGRASYLGEMSVGHQDPGAISSFLILNCLKSIVKEKIM